LRAEKPAQVAGFISEWWPASNRYGGRDQVGISGRIESEIAQAQSLSRPDGVAYTHIHPIETQSYN